jgi:hypothetical protein
MSSCDWCYASGIHTRMPYAVDGRYGDDKTCLRTVRQYWKNTTAALDREEQKVEQEPLLSYEGEYFTSACYFIYKSNLTNFFLVPPEGDEPSTSKA